MCKLYSKLANSGCESGTQRSRFNEEEELDMMKERTTATINEEPFILVGRFVRKLL